MKRALVLAGIVTLLIGAGTAAAHGGLAVTPDHALYDTKTAIEQQVEDLAPNQSEKIKAKLEHAGKRANESSIMADENKTELANQTANAYAEEMQEVNDLGQEISDLAQQRKINELVAEATQHHTKVLSNVYEKVPGPAKSGIRKALNNSAVGHKRAVNALQDSGGIPAGVNSNTSSMIPADVRKQTGIGKPGSIPVLGGGIPGGGSTAGGQGDQGGNPGGAPAGVP
ncbi:MAG: DUF5667 domain-containing protein [Candidatus Nanohaloarchaea archaeon]